MTGIYVHVPFCVKKCAYCDFYSVTDTGLASDYVDALKKEITLYPDSGEIDTVYFGGGTPSVLTPEQINTVLTEITNRYTVSPHAEITLEINPGTVTAESLKGFRDAGINRLSIGIQSFQDNHLAFLGRIHSSNDARQVVGLAEQAGFENMSLDLIYGLPGQDEKNWLKDLTEALSYQPAHMSCYALSIEDGTPLFNAMEENAFTPSDEDMVARLFTRTMEVLDDSGYLHYEVSNYARNESLVSRHNSKYWDFSPYRGFGPSAHSYVPSEFKRYWNVRDLGLYIKRLKDGLFQVEDHEILDQDQRYTETVFLGLRKGEGICVEQVNGEFGMDFLKKFKTTLQSLSEKDMILVVDGRIRLTQKGFLFADGIAAMLIGEEDMLP